jgi:glycosyltransferase involved in cell wall biosynthesis
MSKDILISVVIPVYNCERYLAEAIKSVLAQTHPPEDIVVIDDGSTDSSAQIVARFSPKVQYHWQPNGGVGAARNRGVELARGNFLAFLDADDLWVEDKLARQISAFANEPTLEAVFGQVQQFHSPELGETFKERVTIPIDISRGQHAGAMLITRAAFLRVGWFRTDIQLGEFVDWYARVIELGLKRIMLPEVVMKRRIHETNLGTRHRDARGDYMRVLKASLDRRRQQKKSS